MESFEFRVKGRDKSVDGGRGSWSATGVYALFLVATYQKTVAKSWHLVSCSIANPKLSKSRDDAVAFNLDPNILGFLL